MSVMVGDPLYRPFGTWLQIESQRESAKDESNWKAYHEFAVQNAARPAPEFRTLARQMASQTRNGPMTEDLGSVEARNGNLSTATDYFKRARSCYTNQDDILRVVLEEADAWVKQNKPKRAIDLIRSALRTAPDAPAVPLLRKFEEDAERAASQATPLDNPPSE
jgi:predicted Zn-dependent protease